jgi:hypothetical protein
MDERIRQWKRELVEVYGQLDDEDRRLVLKHFRGSDGRIPRCFGSLDPAVRKLTCLAMGFAMCERQHQLKRGVE